jgi:hypothetical protein
MGFAPGTKEKIKKAIMSVMVQKSSEIQNFGKMEMIKDIKQRQAIDTNLMVNSVISRFIKNPNSVKFQFGISAKPYLYKDPSTPSYSPDSAPNEAPPSFSSEPLGTTVDAAIAVIWGLGVHRSRGARNFPRVAINKIIVKYFGDISKLKNK